VVSLALSDDCFAVNWRCRVLRGGWDFLLAGLARREENGMGMTCARDYGRM